MSNEEATCRTCSGLRASVDAKNAMIDILTEKIEELQKECDGLLADKRALNTEWYEDGKTLARFRKLKADADEQTEIWKKRAQLVEYEKSQMRPGLRTTPFNEYRDMHEKIQRQRRELKYLNRVQKMAEPGTTRMAWMIRKLDSERKELHQVIKGMHEEIETLITDNNHLKELVKVLRLKESNDG